MACSLPDIILSIYLSFVFLFTLSIGCKLQGPEKFGSHHIPSPKHNRGSHDKVSDEGLKAWSEHQ